LQKKGLKTKPGQIPTRHDLQTRVDDILKEVSHVRMGSKELQEKLNSDNRMKQLSTLNQSTSIDLFNQIQSYAHKRVLAWNRVQEILKDYLYFNKSNLNDVADVLLYVTGFRNSETMVSHTNPPDDMREVHVASYPA
jgi:hypothetical protein